MIGTFATGKEAYGEDRVYAQRSVPPKRRPLMEHDEPFRPCNPSKRGYNKTINKFPEYKPNPMRVLQRKKPVEGEEDRPNWRPTYNQKTKPQTSVVTATRNLKKEFPAVFRRF